MELAHLLIGLSVVAGVGLYVWDRRLAIRDTRQLPLLQPVLFDQDAAQPPGPPLPEPTELDCAQVVAEATDHTRNANRKDQR